MIRTKHTKPIHYSPTGEPIVLSKLLLDTLLSQDNSSDLIALYSFYYYTAKWQKTNQPYSTTSYTAKGLGWTVERVRKRKKVLKELKLIDDIQTQNNLGKINGHYIKVNFVWSREKADHHPTEKPSPGLDHTMVKQGENALSSNKENALSSNNKTSRDEKKDRHRPFIPIAKELSLIIQTNKDIRHTPSQLDGWAKAIYRLVIEGEVSEDRIFEALAWYREHIGEKYVPVIESGYTLREKFIRLEDAMKRGKKPKEQKGSAKDVLLGYFGTKSWQRWYKYCFQPLLDLSCDKVREEKQGELAVAILKIHTWYTDEQKVPNLEGREGDEIYSRWQAIPDAFEVVEKLAQWLEGQKWIGDIYPAHLHPNGLVFQKFLTAYQKEVGLNFFDGSSLS